MSMKPRLEQDNKGIPNLASDPLKHPGEEASYEIPGTATCMHPTTNSKIDPKLSTAPKAFGN